MNITVFGAKGRVGSAVCNIAAKRGHCVLAIDKLDIPDSNFVPQVVVDFSTHQATRQVVDYCAKNNCPLVTGVTGHTTAEQSAIDKLSQQVQVVQQANFAHGVKVLQQLCQLAAKLCNNWDIDVIETHRKHKADSPSGTAKKIAALLTKEQGNFGCVTIHSLRSGSNFGKHEIVFGGCGESLTITHQAENCDVFATGALDVAEQIVNKPQN